MDTVKEEIIRLVSALKRSGSAAVLRYIDGSGYFTRGCYSHHTEAGGLAKHSLEVYRWMCRHGGGLPAESVAIAAFFHDLGKTRASDGRGHGARSLDILDECGFELKPDERIAIGNHHDKSWDFITCRLRRVLTFGDCNSTRRWKQEHGV